MKTLVIGVGNEERGDDCVGLLAARALLKKGLSGVIVRELHGDPTLLVEAWENAEAVFLIDAVSSGAVPGTLHRFDVSSAPLLAGDIFRYSTHGTGVADAIELARALKQLPKRLVIYGIEGRTFGFGQAVSPAATAGVDKAIDAILAELRQAKPERQHA